MFIMVVFLFVLHFWFLKNILGNGIARLLTTGVKFIEASARVEPAMGTLSSITAPLDVFGFDVTGDAVCEDNSIAASVGGIIAHVATLAIEPRGRD